MWIRSIAWKGSIDAQRSWIPGILPLSNTRQAGRDLRSSGVFVLGRITTSVGVVEGLFQSFSRVTCVWTMIRCGNWHGVASSVTTASGMLISPPKANGRFFPRLGPLNACVSFLNCIPCMDFALIWFRLPIEHLLTCACLSLLHRPFSPPFRYHLTRASGVRGHTEVKETVACRFCHSTRSHEYSTTNIGSS